MRNRIHTVLAEAKGEDWYGSAASVLLVPYQLEQAAQAIQELVKAGKPVTAGRRGRQSHLQLLDAQIMELTGWLSPPAAKWCRENDRFPQMYPAGGIVLAQANPSAD